MGWQTGEEFFRKESWLSFIHRLIAGNQLVTFCFNRTYRFLRIFLHHTRG